MARNLDKVLPWPRDFCWPFMNLLLHFPCTVLFVYGDVLSPLGVEGPSLNNRPLGGWGGTVIRVQGKDKGGGLHIGGVARSMQPKIGIVHSKSMTHCIPTHFSWDTTTKQSLSAGCKIIRK